MQHTQRQTTTKPRQSQPELLELPTDIDAEKAVLGSILLNREAILAIKDWLKPERFYLARHEQIYTAALSLVAQGTPPDTRTLASELKVRNQLEAVGGLDYLIELVEAMPTSQYIVAYAESVDAAGWRRAVIQAASQVVSLAYTSDMATVSKDGRQILDSAFADRRHHSARVFHISELWEQQFPPLQVLLDGVLYEGVTLFSGRPTMGKSL